MIPAEVIKKKRDGHELTAAEIKYFIDNYMTGEVADYQMSAFLMAAFDHGLSKKEIWNLTSSMLASGSTVKFESSIPKIDKHSTGGVGDKTSLIVGPIVAAAGLQVPMISGRGLGHTGGTLDKLESIPGFDVFLSLDVFRKQVEEVGICFIGQTNEICPADKKMYALRDVTGTVECIGLICASIMSKKLAEGIDGLVLDVKVGPGAFMKTKKEAELLAKNLLEVGRHGKKKVTALLTDMSQPLGRAVGNSLEVEECIEVLQNRGPKDLRDLSLLLSAYMILMGKKVKTIQQAYKLAEDILSSGRALTKFNEIVRLQKGDLHSLPKASHKIELKSPKKGYVKGVDAEKVGLASLLVGAGRTKAEDKIDPSAGIIVHKKIGDRVNNGDLISTLYFNKPENTDEALRLLESAYSFSLQKVRQPRLIIKVMR